ncbi:hypothetical protein ACJ5H2_16960 [Nocardioides sp. R1-1]|uniref:hypothetical protein n=1 Tax=Nocardioides sp. R1-1 TaxID=3383502 RepID=UPI0038D1DEAF
MKKQQWDEIADAILDGIRRAGRDGAAGRSRRQKDKIDEMIRRARQTDDDQSNVSTPSIPRDRSRTDGAVQPLDVDTYAKLKSRAEVGDRLEHDHVPSAAALIKAKEIELDRPLKPDELRDIYNNAATVELPSSVHRDTRTYGGRNTADQIAADAADLAGAANADYKDRIALMLQHGYSQDEVRDAIAKLIDMNKERGIG